MLCLNDTIIMSRDKDNELQNHCFWILKIVYFQHNTWYKQQCFSFAYDVLKRERAEDRAYVGPFPIIII